MARTRRYSDQQREALLHAVLVDRLSVAEAVRRAARGQLQNTGAFTIPYQTASTIINATRHTFEPPTPDPDNAHTALDEAALKIVGHALTTAAKLDMAKNPDPISIKRAADAVFAARRALGPKPRQPAAPDRDPGGAPSEAPKTDVLARLLQQTQTSGANGHQAPAQAV